MRAPTTLPIQSFSSIHPLPLQWLWPLYIPKNKITLLAGDPGTGKTTLTLHLAAQLSRGLPITPTAPPKADGLQSVGPPAFPPDITDTPISLITHSPASPSLSIVHSPLCIPSATLLLSPQDNPADTLLPKLTAMHADLSLIHTLPDFHTLIPCKTPNREIPPPTPLEILDETLSAIPNLALLIIDPITHYLGLTDRVTPTPTKAQGSQSLGSSPRTILHSLTLLAEKHQIAILLTTRLAKKIPEHLAPQNHNSLHRTLGSLAFPTTARSVLLTLPIPSHLADSTTPQSPPSAKVRANVHSIATDLSPSTPTSPEFITHNSEFIIPPPTHILLPLKSNLSHPAPILPFTLSSTLHFHPNPLTYDDLITPEETKSPGPNQLLANSAARWLRTALADGPVASTDLLTDAKRNAISNFTFQVARDLLGIIPIKQQWSGKWFCALPNDPRPLPENRLEKELSEMFDHQNLREKAVFSEIEHQNLRRKQKAQAKKDQNLPQKSQKYPSSEPEVTP